MQETSRRRLLSTTLLAGTAAALAGVASAPARALSTEPLSGALEESYLSVCGGDPLHQGFVDEVMALLEQSGAARDRATVEQILAATSCPYCRCPLNQTAASETPRF